MNKKRVSSSNLALRFYKFDGWTRECLEKYLMKGELYDTEFTHHKDLRENAYYILKPGSALEEAAKKVEWYFTRQHCVSTEPSLPSMLRALKHGT